MTNPESNNEEPCVAVVKVLSGNHSGAVYPCAEGAYAIGSSFDDAIVLTDAGVRPAHVKISIDRRSVSFSDTAGPVRIGKQGAGGNRSLALRYPIEFSVGGTELTVARYGDGGSFTASRLAAAAAILAVGAGAASMDLRLGHSPVRHANASGRLAGGGVGAGINKNAAGAPDAGLVKQAATQLSNYLLQHDLVSVTVSDNGPAVSAKGTIALADRDKWRDAQIWFDSNFGQRVLLVPEIAVAARKEEAAPIRVQAVWAGKNPYVMDSGGNKYFEGSILHNGWLIEKIEETRITLLRNNDRLVLRL